ncbi:MAG: YciI family protein [Myxococcales bacterium]
MKFLMIIESNPSAPPPSPETMQKLGAYTQKMLASGALLMTGGLVRPSKGLKIENKAGKVSVTDGPFAESKELIDGYAIVEAPSREAAIAMSTEFMQIVGDGKGEILQIFDPPGAPKK